MTNDRSREDNTFLVNLFLPSFCDKNLQPNQSASMVDRKGNVFGVNEFHLKQI